MKFSLFMKKKHHKQRNASGQKPCDICEKVEFLEEHHINGRKIKDANLSFNIANICPNCHFKVHLGNIIIEKWTQSTTGRVLLWHNKDEESISGENATPHIIK